MPPRSPLEPWQEFRSITAAISSKTMISKATATVVPRTGVSPSKATIRAWAPSPIQVSGTAVVTLTARDAYGDLETAGGSTVTFRLGSGSARGTLGPVVFQESEPIRPRLLQALRATTRSSARSTDSRSHPKRPR